MMKAHILASSLAAAGMLVACGGRGSGGDNSAPSGSTASGLSLSGVVASGAALAGANVSAKCVSGTGNTVTQPDGSYALTVAGGVLPCALEAVSADKSLTLHSVAAADAGSTSASANITPLTELLVAQLAGGDLTAFMGTIDSRTVAIAVTSSRIARAQSAVLDTVKSAGVDTSALASTSLVSDALVAANGSTAGNAYDKALEALAAQLHASGSTMGMLTASVSAAAANSSSMLLPADLLDQPKAATCDALRSTTYRVVKLAPKSTDPGGSDDPLILTYTMSFDAAKLQSTFAGEPPDPPWQPNASDKCRFGTADGADIVVSPAGVIVARAPTTENGAPVVRTVIAVPVQNIALADLAGKWDVLGWQAGNGGAWSFVADSGTVEVGSDGAYTSARCFMDDNSPTLADSACTNVAGPLGKLTVNSAGGFNQESTDPKDTAWTSRAFAYRSGTGALMLLLVDSDGSFSLATPSHARALPAVGQTQATWNVYDNANLLSPALDATRWTVQSVDAAASRYVRSQYTIGKEANVMTQTVDVNSPRDGYTHRLASSGTFASGAAYTVREFYALGLPGMGLSAVYVPRTNATGNSNALFIASVNQSAR